MSQNTFVLGAGPGHQAAPAFPTSTTPTSAPAPATPAQRSAQAALQQNAQLPGIDMSALAGVSPDTVALIARLLQSGALPLPPAPAGPVQALAAAAPSNALPLQPVLTQQEDVEMDKEEGEVEEGETDNAPLLSPPREPRAIPTGPRNAASRGSSRRDTRGRQTVKTPPRRFSSPHNTSQQNRKRTGVDDYAAKEKQSKDFVLAMHQAGYSYRQLAEMVENPQPLRRLFKSLGLPVSSDHGLLNNNVQPARDPRLQAVSPLPSNSVGKAPPAEDSQKPSATKPPAPSKPAGKADRTAYLAKLQALKAGKAGPATIQPTPPGNVPEPSSAGVPLTTTETQQIAPSPAQPAATSTPASKAVKTELARQRLEAFKAERAAMQQNRSTLNGPPPVSTAAYVPTASQTADPPSQMTTSHGGLGAGLNGIATSLVQQSSPAALQETPFSIASRPVFSPTSPPPSQSLFSPTSPPPTRSFSGLPGLFMNGTRRQASSPVASQPIRTASQPITQAVSAIQQSTLPRKRLVTADFASVPPPVKRPFGQSRSASEDVSFIIENSDDEDGDIRMDVDITSSAMPTRTESYPDAPSLQDFSSRPDFQRVSTPGTPGASTPGGMTYEQKVKEIEDLNRRIAEKAARAKAQGRAAVSSRADATAAASGLPGISVNSRTASTLHPVQEQAATPVLTTATPERPASAAALKLKQQKEDLSRRLAELENARRQTSIPPPPLATNTTPAGVTRPPGGIHPTAGPTAPALTSSAGKASSADGESENESDFDFYGEDEPVDTSKPSDGLEHVGSQATTVSHVTEADELPKQASLATAADPSQLGLTSTEAEIVDQMANAMTESVTVPAGGFGGAEVVAENIAQPLVEAAAGIEEEASESAQAQPTPPDSDVEMESEASDSGDSSDDRISDLNESHELANAYDGPGGTAALNVTMESSNPDSANGDGIHVADVEGSDASSTRSSDSDSEEYEPEPADEQSGNSLILQDARMADDDLAPELQPTEEEQAATEPRDQQLPNDIPKVHYTPYDSILTRFKDYRYHPRYLQLVPTGYRSRTYNHQIDPLKQLCQTEAQGGTCQDRDCGGQHFDKMGISDNVLLQQMGTKNIPARGPDETQRWNAGLQEVIKSLKAANVRDAITIAARIADYRREFVGDPTRVVFP